MENSGGFLSAKVTSGLTTFCVKLKEAQTWGAPTERGEMWVPRGEACPVRRGHAVRDELRQEHLKSCRVLAEQLRGAFSFHRDWLQHGVSRIQERRRTGSWGSRQ